jgi:RES domain-containing protein
VTPLPAALGGNNELVAWRLDAAQHAPTWDSGEGAFQFGGRWNSKRVRAVYCSLDPATAILEVAVHKGFVTLDTVAHVLTAVTISDPASVNVVEPDSLPNPNWLRPGVPGAGQRAHGDALLGAHKFVVIPSAVSVHSWNLIFVASAAAGAYRVKMQERFALDTRLHPPA